jgi:putative ABC transport system ATP-binding protein
MASVDDHLKVSNLRFRFAGQSSDLFRIDHLTIESGQTVGIRGASGAGKTTLMHCLAGIEAIAAGSILWGEHEISSLSPLALTRWRQRHLGLVFQDFHLVEGLSALDNVLLPASFNAWRPTSILRARAGYLLSRVAIDSPGRPAELLSRGERQRVAVARALLLEPEVLLADEPTASLDPENRDATSRLLLDLAHEHGATLVVISHDTALLEHLDARFELRDGTLHALEPNHV